MNYNNQIPAWSYAKISKQAQFANIPDYGIQSGDSEPPKTTRYRGIMVYEVNVPSQPDNPEAEQAAADEAAQELYQRVHNAVGDEVLEHNPPEEYI